MRLNGWTAAVAAIVLFAAGAASAWLWKSRTASAPAPASAAAPMSTTASSDIVTIPADVLQRAGLVTQVVEEGSGSTELRVPGSVQPNAYRKVTVTPLAAGRVTRVFVELGQSVTRGAALAEVYSPELAEVRARYGAAHADVEAGEARLRRTERLVAIGSASQQELETARAEHVRHEVELREAAARLRLFGIDPSLEAHAPDNDAATTSVIRVSAPQAGVVVERPASVGMSAEASTPLVTIAETSPVWIVADVYERDFSRVSNGAIATITSEAFPGWRIQGRVGYIAPDVRPETRTTQVRIEVPNPDRRLRFGMFVSVALGAAARRDGLAVPAAALQTIGSETVVFVPDSTSGQTFRERRVQIGERVGDMVRVVSGLSKGERVVTQGSFALRAEAERQGTRPSDPPESLTVRITTAGFEPNAVEVKPGVPLRLTFLRQTDETCAKDVVLVDYGIRRELPLDVPVTVEFTPRKSFVFQCGMKMLSGTMTVR